MAKVLVTGSAGFIGMHVALRLAEEGHEVVGIDNLNTYYSVDLKLARLRNQGINTNEIQYNRLLKGANNISFVQIDLVEQFELTQLFKTENFNYVVHLAAQAGVRYSIENPHAYIDSNVKGFLDILECCSRFKVEHLIYASSSSVYGANEEVPFMEDHKTEAQVSLYAATKKANEAMANSYASVHEILATGLRFFTVYGPYGRPDMALFKFTKKILDGEAIDVYNNGHLERDFTYIDDIVDGITRFVDLNPQNRESKHYIYNIGRGKPIKLMDFIHELEEAIGKKAKKNFLPMQAGDCHQTWADTSKLAADTGYAPKVNLEQGVKSFVDWYLNYYRVN
jgi:UDP-glucuronate 4-epimerase